MIVNHDRVTSYFSGAPISWKSIKQVSVSLSTMEAEYATLCEISRQIIYVKRILKHMGFEKYVASPIDVFCDNQSTIEMSKNAVCHKHSKHIDISYHFTRELVKKKEIAISYFQTNLLPAHQGITEIRVFAWYANVEFE